MQNTLHKAAKPDEKEDENYKNNEGWLTNTNALVEQLERLFRQADERDRLKKGSAGLFSRQELYALIDSCNSESHSVQNKTK
jgi:hypothetical protein